MDKQPKKRWRDAVTELFHVKPKHLVEIPEKIIRVASFNMRFAAGSDDNEFWKQRDEKIIKRNLDSIAQFFLEKNVDVLNLQEVDFDSERTNGLNQGEYLATAMGFDYAEARNIIRKEKTKWFRFARKLTFGNATLSRFPIKEHHNYYYTARDSFLSFIKLITLRDEQKAYLECELDYGGAVPLYVVNTHLEARNMRLREKETERLEDYMAKRQTVFKIIAGDLNCPLPHSPRHHNFREIDPIGDNDDYRGDTSLEKLLSSQYVCFPEGLRPEHCARAADGTLAYPTDQFTHPSWKPNRTLDYILVSPPLRFHIQDGYPLYSACENLISAKEPKLGYPSDHLPIIADVVIPADVVTQGGLKDLLLGKE